MTENLSNNLEVEDYIDTLELNVGSNCEQKAQDSWNLGEVSNRLGHNVHDYWNNSGKNFARNFGCAI